MASVPLPSWVLSARAPIQSIPENLPEPVFENDACMNCSKQTTFYNTSTWGVRENSREILGQNFREVIESGPRLPAVTGETNCPSRLNSPSGNSRTVKREQQRNRSADTQFTRVGARAAPVQSHGESLCKEAKNIKNHLNWWKLVSHISGKKWV